MASIRIYQANRRSFAAPRPFVQMLSPGQIVHATYISPAPPHRRPYGPCVCGEPPGAPRLGCGVQRGSEAPQSQQRGSRLPGPAAPLRACHAAAETDVSAASTLVCVRGNDNLLQAPRPVGWMVPKTGSAAGRRGRVLPRPIARGFWIEGFRLPEHAGKQVLLAERAAISPTAICGVECRWNAWICQQSEFQKHCRG